ncbi:MAG TPA: DUF2167 domain-containing protein [Terracidiphilus sp.]|nr:DUF2167 domain-containing protein [Terracidiphilus sp.]
MLRSFLRHCAVVVCAGGLLLAATPAGSGQASQSDQAPHPSPIKWQKGPMTAQVGDIATIDVPKDFLFADGDGARKAMEMMQNPTDGQEVGFITPKSDKETWYIIFEFDPVGYVKDDDRASLDDDAILKSIQDGTEEANKTRKEKGWAPIHITGWHTQPYYDQVTNNLTWAVDGAQDKGENPNVNYSVRILGRRGTMNVDLVLDPNDLAAVEPQFKSIMTTFRFTAGSRYADFTEGDKLAGYGLTALIAGGAGAVAAKTGLLAKLWKLIVAAFAALWKLIVVIFAAIGTFFKRLWAKVTGSRKEIEKNEFPPADEPGVQGSSNLVAAGQPGAGTDESRSA